jgi:alpha,alpha-trehalase
VNSWALTYEGFDPQQEGLREALCTLGNGYFATRGAAPESEADGVHYPGTYLAGGYNRLNTEISARIIENEDLVNLPNWLSLNFRIGEGNWIRLEEVEILEYRQTLDIKRGLLLRTVRFRDVGGRQTLLRQRRFVHMAKRHLAALETVVCAENWSGPLTVRTALDGRVVNSGVERYRDLNGHHLLPLSAEADGEETLYLKVRTSQSELQVAQAARTRVFMNNKRLSPQRRTALEPGRVFQLFEVELEEGGEARVEKVVALFTSRDQAVSECGLEARKAIGRAGSFDDLLTSHIRDWGHLWRRFDIALTERDGEEGERNLMVLRLHVFHLLQTVSLHTMDLDVGVPSRGWHGEAYRGHVFWDELFIFPLLNLRLPEITRTLLQYRYRRLDEARAAARNSGFRGALFPWQSGSNGREESQEVHFNPRSGRWIPDRSSLQRHVNAAIAYNVWQYFQVTRDSEFLNFYGAEMILEIARLWSSLATWNKELERYEILGVMGPDEYHDAYPWTNRPGLDNNAYTNLMAVWVLATALEMFDHLPDDRRRELCERIGLDSEELELWEDISRRILVVFHGDGIISQFEGYDRLEELDWDTYRREHGEIMRLDRILEAEGDTPNRYKASKQADVLMLFYLFSSEELNRLFGRLGYAFSFETIPRNIDYYLRRTSHGSTLSQVVHSWVLARSDREASWRHFVKALKSDVADVQGGTTPEGIHLGAMAGTVDLVQRCYTGVEVVGDELRLNPCLPQELARLELRLRYRGHSLELDVSDGKLLVRCLDCSLTPIAVVHRGKRHELQGGGSLEIEL